MLVCVLVASGTVLGILGGPVGPQAAHAAPTVTSGDGRLSLTYTASATVVNANERVTYTYVVKNLSSRTLYFGSLKDTGCARIEGSRSALAAGASRTMTCETRVTVTTTSTATLSMYSYEEFWDPLALWSRRYSFVRSAESVTVNPVVATPFGCETPTVFVGAGTPTTTLWQQYQEPAGSKFIALGAPQRIYNAMAFNPADRFIYGISQGESPGYLVRLDADGRLSTVGGAIAGWDFTTGAVDPSTARSNWVADIRYGINAGAMSPDGEKYWVGNMSSSGKQVVYELNIAARTIQQISTTRFPTNDFTLKDGFLWGIQNRTSATDADPRTMLRMNPETGVVDSFVLSGLSLPADVYGAAWTYGNGNLGFDRNATDTENPNASDGRLFQIQVSNPTSAIPGFTLVYSAPAPGSYNNDGTSCVGPNTAVDLGVEKLGPATTATGQRVTWTLRVTNHGPGISSGGFLDDTVPAGFTEITVSSAYRDACTVTGRLVQCSTGVLNPGDTQDITFTAVAPSTPGTYVNTVGITGNEADPTPANNTSTATTAVNSAVIDVRKTPDTPSATGPDADGAYRASYTITVRNTGTAAGTYTQITDVPRFTGATIKTLTWSGGSASTPSTPVPANPDGSYPIGTSASKTLPAGATHVYTVTLTFTPTPTAESQLTLCEATPTPGFGMYNVVTVPQEATDKIGADNAACINPAPAIQVSKTVTRAGDPGPAAGDTLSIDAGAAVDFYYHVSLPTGYTEALRGVTVTDDKLGPVTTRIAGDNGDNRLDKGETWVYRYANVAPQATVTNTGTATGTGVVTGIQVSDSDTATVTVASPLLGLAKTAGAFTGPDSSGSYTATFTVRVTNPNPVEATYGPITDTLGFDPAVRPTAASWTGPANTSGTTALPTATPGTFTLGRAGTVIAAGSAAAPTTHVYSLTVTFEYVGAATVGACAATPGSGLFNTVSLPAGQENTDDNAPNSACISPPTYPVTVTKHGNCAPGDPSCPIAGSRFALYTTDPSTPGATPLTDALTADANQTVFTTIPLTVNQGYWLVETRAPSGHSLLATPVHFTVGTTGVALQQPTRHGGVVATNRFALTITDTTRGTLPQAGASGPFAYLGVGLLLITAGLGARLHAVVRIRSKGAQS